MFSDRLCLPNDYKVLDRLWSTVANIWRNRGELAEGWYDPETLRKAQVSAADYLNVPSRSPIPTKTLDDHVTEDEEDEGYGPALPSKSENPIERARNMRQPGPSIPNTQDLKFQRGITDPPSEPSYGAYF